jgi:hypothetical protein
MLADSDLHLLEAPRDDLELADGRIRVRGAPTSGVTLAQIAQKAYLAPTELPPGIEPGLEATHAFDPPALTFSSGTHVCEVEIDPETGDVTIPRYTIVEDCGRMLNPRVVEGQLHGATAQGLAGALFEEVLYEANGQNLSATFLEYAVPTAARLPAFDVEHLERPGPRHAARHEGHGRGRRDGRLGGGLERRRRRPGRARRRRRPPALHRASPRRGAPRSIELGAPTWPPNPPTLGGALAEPGRPSTQRATDATRPLVR